MDLNRLPWRNLSRRPLRTAALLVLTFFLSFVLHVCYNNCKEKRELLAQFSLDSYFAVAHIVRIAFEKAMFL